MNWEHLRTLEAVARLGSMTAASLALGVSQSTVSRHLARLEDDADSPLLVRESPLRLTDRGHAVLEATLPMLDAAQVAEAALRDEQELTGEVTLTTVGELVRWVLSPRLSLFYERYPRLLLRILVDNRVNSLAAGEADVALRLGRPERGDLVARRIETISYSFFASNSLEISPGVPWLGLAGSLSRLPEQRQMERAFSPRPARLLVEDLETLGRAVEAGLGVAYLPDGLGESLHGVTSVAAQRLDVPEPDLDARETWLVVHSAKQHLPRVRAVLDWLDTAFELRD